jgi:ribosomal protein S18 acetylase RimI-like enzyme
VRCEPVTPALAGSLADLFDALRAAGDERHFHPHPLTHEEAERLAGYGGLDVYRVLTDEGRVVGYGMLRGWDEGYEVPSLGIAVHPEARGVGAGRLLMEHLHEAARERGATRVRLRVYPDNTAARHLYEELGYVLQPANGELVGVLEL